MRRRVIRQSVNIALTLGDRIVIRSLCLISDLLKLCQPSCLRRICLHIRRHRRRRVLLCVYRQCELEACRIRYVLPRFRFVLVLDHLRRLQRQLARCIRVRDRQGIIVVILHRCAQFIRRLILIDRYYHVMRLKIIGHAFNLLLALRDVLLDRVLIRSGLLIGDLAKHSGPVRCRRDLL